MIRIYHNKRCSKSREGLKILENSGKEFKIINYLENSLSIEDLEKIIELLGIEPINLIRKNEAVWKENFKNKNLSDIQIIEAMLNYPKLIERPIIINGNKAIIGRPPELITEII